MLFQHVIFFASEIKKDSPENMKNNSTSQNASVTEVGVVIFYQLI